MQTFRQHLPPAAMLLTTCVALVALVNATDGQDPADAAEPAFRKLRTFKSEDMQKALAGTEARQQQFLKEMTAKSRRKGTWKPLGMALGSYGLNQNDKGDKAILGSYEKEFAATSDRARGPWYNFGLEQRLLFLFGSQSKVNPKRMSPDVEKLLMTKMWTWASATTRLEMTKPERDWWSIGSENHWTHLWTGMWGAAQLFANHPDYKDKRYTDGTTPAQMAKAFDEMAKRFARERGTKGLLVEVNSAYNKQTLSGLYNVVDFATDPVLKERMRMFFDVLWADWAIEQIDGVRGGSRARSYPGSHSNVGSSLSPIAWYHFGVGEPEISTHPDVWCAATTSYRPLPLVVEMLLDVQGRGTYASISRRPGRRDEAVDEKKVQFVGDPKNVLHEALGHVMNPSGGGLLRYSWCTPDFILGTSMVEAHPSSYWWTASSQNRWDGLFFGGHNRARIHIQPQPIEGRSFFNANWSVQSKGVLVVQRLKDGMSEDAKGQRVWFDDTLKLVEKDGWVFAQGPRAYAAVRVVEGKTDWQKDVPPRDEKPGPGKWLNCQQEFSPVILEVARASDHTSFAAFQKAILANPLTWKDKRLDYSSNLYKTKVTLFADYSKLPQVEGVAVNYSPVKVYDSPFVQADFGKGIVTLRKGERQVVLGFNE